MSTKATAARAAKGNSQIMKDRTSTMDRSSVVEKNCHRGSSKGMPMPIPIRIVPAAVTFGTPTAIMAGMPMTPASRAAGAEPVTEPHNAETTRMPRATTTGLSPPNSTVLRTSVLAIAVSCSRDPSQEPSSTAIMVEASVIAPSSYTVVSRLFSAPKSVAPATSATAVAMRNRAKAVGTFPVRMRTTPTAIMAMMMRPTVNPP